MPLKADGWHMDYTVYKLKFPVGVHFGKGSIETSGYSVCADAFFSALCVEAVKEQESLIETLVNSVREGKLLISDGLPFIGDEFYLPKPLITIENKVERGDSVVKKAYKKLEYIPVECLSDYLKGEMDISDIAFNERLGMEEIKVSAAIREGEDTLPYRIGTFLFNEGNGLYIVIGYSDDSVKELISRLIEGLSYSGLGGRRSSGLGNFMPIKGRMTDEMLRLLNADTGRYMTISLSLPKDNEIETVLSDASYQLIKRSGFVSSDRYSDTYLRKKDLYVTAAGSVYTRKFDGDIFDVSSGGRHPVWRYAKPMFIGI